MNKLDSRAGFTLIELLIVIVVIAILAAITIVAYNGIQARASATATEATVEQYKKGILAYVAANNQYPINSDTFCLGEVDNYPNGCFYGGQAYSSVSTALKTVMSSLPQVDTSCRYMYSGDCRRNLTLYYQAGATLDGVAHSHYLVYFLEKNQNCNLSGNLGGTWEEYSSVPNSSGYFERDSSTGVTMCIMGMPSPNTL